MKKRTANNTVTATLLATMALSSVPAPAQAGILDAITNLGKGVANVTNHITANIPIVGGLYQATGAYDAVNQALGAKGYLSMPSDWTTFTVDARTAAVSRVLQGNAFLRNADRLDIKVNQAVFRRAGEKNKITFHNVRRIMSHNNVASAAT